jgi:hypothetical protein
MSGGVCSWLGEFASWPAELQHIVCAIQMCQQFRGLREIGCGYGGCELDIVFCSNWNKKARTRRAVDLR